MGRRLPAILGALLLTAGCSAPLAQVNPDPNGSPTATANADRVPEAIDPTLSALLQGAYLARPATTVVASPTVIRAGEVTCLLTPADGSVPGRVDCQVVNPRFRVTEPNPGCQTWGNTVRLVAGQAQFTCSAPLARPTASMATWSQVVIGGLLCGNGPNGIVCQDTIAGGGFRIRPTEVSFLPTGK